MTLGSMHTKCIVECQLFIYIVMTTPRRVAPPTTSTFQLTWSDSLCTMDYCKISSTMHRIYTTEEIRLRTPSHRINSFTRFYCTGTLLWLALALLPFPLSRTRTRPGIKSRPRVEPISRFPRTDALSKRVQGGRRCCTHSLTANMLL